MDTSQLWTTDTDEAQMYLSQYLRKRTVKLHPPIVLYIMQTLVDHFRKTVRHRRWIQKLGAILALLLIVLAFSPWYSTGQVTSHITMPTGSIPNAHNGYLRIPHTQQWSFPLLANEKFRIAMYQSSVYCINTLHFYASSIALAILEY